jgi:NADH dehydrogenase FAD-containing subunit
MTRIVVAGLGDAGVMTAMHLRRTLPRADVVGISPSPGLVSGQELGLRLARPGEWTRDFRFGYERLRRLDGVQVVHGRLTELQDDARAVVVDDPAGRSVSLPYDVLVIATGVAAGFWRRDDVRTLADVDDETARHHRRLADAERIAVVGGGASAVSSAVQLAGALPGTRVDLYFPGDGALTRHHPRVWTRVAARLEHAGVHLHPGHRAVVPTGAGTGLGEGPVRWSTGQPDAPADVVLWAVGTARPHTGWLPPDLLDDAGYVRVGPTLQVPGRPHVFAVGDVAATDPARSSARNFGGRLVARNVAAHLAGKPPRDFRPGGWRWGSVLGPLDDGLLIFTPNGWCVRAPRPVYDHVLQPVFTRYGIWGGIRA